MAIPRSDDLSEGAERIAEKLDPKEVVTFKELHLSNTFEQEALVLLLEKRGIISRAALFEEIDNLQKGKTKSS
jgi:hypothetical protein